MENTILDQPEQPWYEQKELFQQFQQWEKQLSEEENQNIYNLTNIFVPATVENVPA